MFFLVRNRFLSRFFSLFLLITFSLGGFFIAPRSAGAAGSLYISPSTLNAKPGASFTVSVRVSTSGNSINAAEGLIVFDSSKLQVVSISKSGSIFNLWTVEPKFSNAGGTLEFGGGLPSPGYVGASGLILTVNFKAKATANATSDISLSSGSILANDGEGTNILNSLGKTRVVFGGPSVTTAPTPKLDKTPTPSATPIISSGIPSPDISSPTNPDSDTWYNNRRPKFTWNLPDDIDSVKLALSKSPTSAPTISYSPAISEKELEDVEDGVWYFIAQYRKGSLSGKPASYRFKVDATKPKEFNIARVDTDDATNPRPELTFDTVDVLSGIDHYIVQIGDDESIKVDQDQAFSGYELPLQEAGQKNIVVRAYDKAGNYAEANYNLKVASIEPPRLLSVSVANGSTVTVRGTAQPFQKVRVVMRSDIIEKETSADETGNFTITFSANDLKAGEHIVFVKSIDERGAVSSPSNELTVTIQPRKLAERIIDSIKSSSLKVISFVATNRTLIIIILVAIIALLLIRKFLVPKIAREIKRMRKALHHRPHAVKKHDQKIQKKITNVIDEVAKLRATLKELTKSRTLREEETEIKKRIENLSKTLKTLK